jgi:hypothetical protein
MSERVEKGSLDFSSGIYYLLKVEKNDEVTNPKNRKKIEGNQLLRLNQGR